MYCPERQRFSLLYVLKSDLKKNIANKVRCGHQSSQLGRGATLKLNYLLHTLLNANRAAENDNSKLQYAISHKQLNGHASAHGWLHNGGPVSVCVFYAESSRRLISDCQLNRREVTCENISVKRTSSLPNLPVKTQHRKISATYKRLTISWNMFDALYKSSVLQLVALR